MTAVELALQYVSRRHIVVGPEKGYTAQQELIVFWEDDQGHITPMAWNDDFQAEETRLMEIREDVLLRRADAKGAIILFEKKKARWEKSIKEAKGRLIDTCEYFIFLYEKAIAFSKSVLPEHAPDTQVPEADPEIPDFVLSIAGYYPKFIKHYPELVKAEYIKPKDTGLQWLKSKQSLAEYFSAIKPKDKSNNWTVLENIFGMKNLRNAASQNGNPFKNKKSKDFEALQGIITRL